jgi:hypothetical protein
MSHSADGGCSGKTSVVSSSALEASVLPFSQLQAVVRMEGRSVDSLHTPTASTSGKSERYAFLSVRTARGAPTSRRPASVHAAVHKPAA